MFSGSALSVRVGVAAIVASLIAVIGVSSASATEPDVMVTHFMADGDSLIPTDKRLSEVTGCASVGCQPGDLWVAEVQKWVGRAKLDSSKYISNFSLEVDPTPTYRVYSTDNGATNAVVLLRVVAGTNASIALDSFQSLVTVSYTNTQGAAGTPWVNGFPLAQNSELLYISGLLVQQFTKDPLLGEGKNMLFFSSDTRAPVWKFVPVPKNVMTSNLLKCMGLLSLHVLSLKLVSTALWLLIEQDDPLDRYYLGKMIAGAAWNWVSYSSTNLACTVLYNEILANQNGGSSHG